MLPCLRPALTALAFCLLLPAVAGAAVHARLTPRVELGAGHASALYVGDEDGSRSYLLLSPGLSFDLSTSPWLKFFATYRYAFTGYDRGGDGQGHEGELLARLRMGFRWDVELFGGVDRMLFPEPVSALPSDPLSSRSIAISAGTRVRHRLRETSTAELTYGLQRRRSDADEVASVFETSHEIDALWLERMRPDLQLGARLRWTSSAASEAIYDYGGVGASLLAGFVPFGDLVLRGSVGVHFNQYEVAGHDDRFAFASFTVSHPLGESLWADASLSYARNDLLAGRAEGYEGDRSAGFFGLRAELPWWL